MAARSANSGALLPKRHLPVAPACGLLLFLLLLLPPPESLGASIGRPGGSAGVGSAALDGKDGLERRTSGWESNLNGDKGKGVVRKVRSFWDDYEDYSEDYNSQDDEEKSDEGSGTSEGPEGATNLLEEGKESEEDTTDSTADGDEGRGESEKKEATEEEGDKEKIEDSPEDGTAEEVHKDVGEKSETEEEGDWDEYDWEDDSEEEKDDSAGGKASSATSAETAVTHDEAETTSGEDPEDGGDPGANEILTEKWRTGSKSAETLTPSVKVETHEKGDEETSDGEAVAKDSESDTETEETDHVSESTEETESENDSVTDLENESETATETDAEASVVRAANVSTKVEGSGDQDVSGESVKEHAEEDEDWEKEDDEEEEEEKEDKGSEEEEAGVNEEKHGEEHGTGIEKEGSGEEEEETEEIESEEEVIHAGASGEEEEGGEEEKEGSGGSRMRGEWGSGGEEEEGSGGIGGTVPPVLGVELEGKTEDEEASREELTTESHPHVLVHAKHLVPFHREKEKPVDEEVVASEKVQPLGEGVHSEEEEEHGAHSKAKPAEWPHHGDDEEKVGMENEADDSSSEGEDELGEEEEGVTSGPHSEQTHGGEGDEEEGKERGPHSDEKKEGGISGFFLPEADEDNDSAEHGVIHQYHHHSKDDEEEEGEEGGPHSEEEEEEGGPHSGEAGKVGEQEGREDHGHPSEDKSEEGEESHTEAAVIAVHMAHAEKVEGEDGGPHPGKDEGGEEVETHGPHPEKAEEGEEADVTTVHAEDGGGDDDGSGSHSKEEEEEEEDDSEYSVLPFDYDDKPLLRKKTESEEDPFGQKFMPPLPNIIADISEKVIKGIFGADKSSTTQKIPPSSNRPTATVAVSESPESESPESESPESRLPEGSKANIVAIAAVADPEVAETADSQASGGEGVVSGAEGSTEKPNDSLVTWMALGVVVVVLVALLGYLYVRGKKTGKGVKRGGGEDEEKAQVSKDVEMSLLGEKAYPAPNYYGDGDYQSVALEPEEGSPEKEKEVEAEVDSTMPPEPTPPQPAQQQPLSDEPPKPVIETERVKVVATLTETPKPMVPVYLNGRGANGSPLIQDGVTVGNSR